MIDPRIRQMMHEFFALLSPHEFVHRDVLRRQAERRERSERVNVLLARTTALLDAAEAETDPVAIMRLVDAANGCRQVIEEMNAG
jgi:hypothetical protein